MNDNTERAKIVLRIGISLLFLWFGTTQLTNPAQWISFLPGWATSLPVTQTTFIYINGSAEIILGLFLICGLYTRISSLLLGIHLLGIALSLGYSPTMIRDLALTIATMTIFLNGPDKASLDARLANASNSF